MENLVKVRLTRGVTIADPPLHEPGEGDPPTFAPGEVVSVKRALAQQMVGSGKAEYVSGTLVEPAPYEAEEADEDDAEVVTAEALPTETAMKSPPRGRRG